MNFYTCMLDIVLLLPTKRLGTLVLGANPKSKRSRWHYGNAIRQIECKLKIKVEMNLNLFTTIPSERLLFMVNPLICHIER
jgi:hypothetical protein